MNVIIDFKTEQLNMLTREQVAKCLGTHKDTISKLTSLGLLKSTKIGKAYMYSQFEIFNFQIRFAGYDLSNTDEMIKSLNDVKENGMNFDMIKKDAI